VMVASSAGWLDAALSLPGSVTCGLAWLLSRALFRPSGKVGNWPIIVVCGLFVSGVLLMGADALAISGTPALRMVDNLHSLASSTVLLMTLFEAVDGLGKGAAKYERRFRFIFLAGYAALLGISVVWFRGVADATGGVEVAKAVCAALALAGACAAVVYRQRSSAPLRRREQAGEADLAARLRTLLDSEEIYRDADIKVRDVARYLNEPEYKVSQCITGPLGYANFNRLINAHRIKAAMDGSWKSQDIWDGIGPGMVQFAEFSKRIPEDVRKMAAKARDDIAAGKLHPFTGPINKQDGSVWLKAGQTAPDGDLAGMNFYVEGVEGSLPK